MQVVQVMADRAVRTAGGPGRSCGFTENHVKTGDKPHGFAMIVPPRGRGAWREFGSAIRKLERTPEMTKFIKLMLAPALALSLVASQADAFGVEFVDL